MLTMDSKSLRAQEGRSNVRQFLVVNRYDANRVQESDSLHVDVC